MTFTLWFLIAGAAGRLMIFAVGVSEERKFEKIIEARNEYKTEIHR